MPPTQGHNYELAPKRRRRHNKSRGGCFECKRRRIKCDEIKPSCTRCVLGLHNCEYPPPPVPVKLSASAHSGKDQPQFLCWSIDDITPKPVSLQSNSHPTKSPEPEPEPDFQAEVEAHIFNPPLNVSSGPSDAELYKYYLEHTSQASSLSRSDYTVLSLHIPDLALQSEIVYHSVLAVSAANMAWTMINNETTAPELGVVNQILLTGYQHYNLASEKMRMAMCESDALNMEPVLASALILVPFASSSQQINHWISSHQGAEDLPKRLSSTPRDIIIMMQGIRAMLETLDEDDGSFAMFNLTLSTETETMAPLPFPNTFDSPAASRTHMMHSMIAATSSRAFSKLQQRLDSLALAGTEDPMELEACRTAFEIVDHRRNAAFSNSNTPSTTKSPQHTHPYTSTSTPSSISSPSALSPSNLSSSYLDNSPFSTSSTSRISPWLLTFASHSFASPSSTSLLPPSPSSPLTRFFLSFLAQAPQAYLDLVLPLLDHRIDKPTPTSSPADASGTTTSGVPPALTPTQALALDIYAHWSVLMFLVEHESWWIGGLPEVTLSGMVNAYGEEFVEQSWWPAGMLRVLREGKAFV